MSRRPIQARIQTRADEAASSGGLSGALLREAYSCWASGVSVVSVTDGEEIDAITVSALTPVSVDPPLVLVCIAEHASVLVTLLQEKRFTIGLLPEDARRVASTVASRLPLRELPFAGEGDPVLAGALATLVCRLHETHPGGDHRIVVGEVERVELGAARSPLLYYRREYRRLDDTPPR